MPLLVCLLLIYMFCNPETSLAGATNGLMLWFRTVLPALLPFIILSNILIHTDFIPKFLDPFKKIFQKIFSLSPYGTYAMILGFLCGYPMGCKITSDLYKAKKISGQEGEYLLAFANNPSPVFIITYVLEENLQRYDLLWPTIGCIYLSALLSGCIYRKIHSVKVHSLTPDIKKASKVLPLGETIDASIISGFETITKLGGYMILSSIAVYALTSLPLILTPLKYLLAGTLEISTAVHQIMLWPLLFERKYILTLVICSFGGLCVLLQTASVIRNSGLPLKPYLEGKLYQTILTLIIALIIAKSF